MIEHALLEAPFKLIQNRITIKINIVCFSISKKIKLISVFESSLL